MICLLLLHRQSAYIHCIIRDRKMLLDRRAKGKQQAEKGKHSEESVAMET